MARLLRSKSAGTLKINPPSSHADFLEPTPRIPPSYQQKPNTPLTYEFVEQEAVEMRISAPSIRRRKSTVSKKKSGVLKEVKEEETVPLKSFENSARVLKKRRDPNASNLATPTYNYQSVSNSSLMVPIGMAVGSPRELGARSPGRSPARSPVPSSRSLSPAYLPPTKYGTVTEVSVSSGKENIPAGETRGGWKKLFGKGGFFAKKPESEQSKARKTAASRETTESPEVESMRSYSQNDESEYQNVPIIIESAPRSPSPMPKLDIEIPEIKMERYSVMFGSIMQNNNRASLYARRRSRLVAEDDGQPKLFLNSLKRNATTGQISRSPRTPRSPDCFNSNLQQALQSLNSSNYLRPSDLPSPTKKRLTFQRDSTVMPSLYFMNNMSQSVPEFVDEERMSCEILEDEPIIHGAVASSRATTVTVSSPESLHSKRSESIKTPTGSFDAGDDVWLQNEGTWLASPSEAAHSSPDIDDTMKAAQMSIARQISMSQQQLLLPVVRARSQKAVFSSALTPEAWAQSPYSIRESEEEYYIAQAM